MKLTRPLNLKQLFGSVAASFVLLLSPCFATSAAAVSNDNFSNRINITTPTVKGKNGGATKEAGEADKAGQSGGKSVWWTWTATTTERINITTEGSNFDTLLAVYTGTSVDSLVEIDSNDDVGYMAGDRWSVVSLDVEAGTTYQIAVDGYNGRSGSIQLNIGCGTLNATASSYEVGSVSGGGIFVPNSTRTVIARPNPGFTFSNWTENGKIVSLLPSYMFTFNDSRWLVANFTGDGQPPSNDAFANRKILSDETQATNYYATKELGEPNHAQAAGGGSVWWSWTATASGAATIKTESSSLETLLAVYSGTAMQELQLVASNHASQSSGEGSTVHFSAVAGTTYQIAVDGFEDAHGEFGLAVTPPVTAIVPPNDDFANRASFTRTATGQSVKATSEPNDPDLCSGNKSTWWSWTAPASGRTTIMAQGINFHSTVGVFTGDSLDALSMVTPVPSEGFPNPENTLVTFDAVAGTTYQIDVDAIDGVGGSIQLTTTPPAGSSPRELRLPSMNISSDEATLVPVLFVATGKENTIRFSVSFDPVLLTSGSVELGSGATGATLVVNSDQAANGRLGITLSKPAGQSFGSGTKELVRIPLTGAPRANANTYLRCGDSPVARAVSDAKAKTLVTSYTDGLLAINRNAGLYVFVDPVAAGTVSGGGIYPIGSTQQITATANPGWAFAGWSDGEGASNPRSVIVPESGGGVSALFVQVPAISLWKGSYSGVVDSAVAGLINITLDAKGGFSASIKMNGSSYSFKGKLSASGAYSGPLSRSSPWDISLQMDSATGEITGLLYEHETPQALVIGLSLSRSLRDSNGDTAAMESKYTFLLQSNVNDTNAPIANGYGTLSVNKKGAIHMTGKLADGTAFTQSSEVTQNSTWALYVPLYSKKGYVSGQVSFAKSGGRDLDGSFGWCKPPKVKDKMYPEGISTRVTLRGRKFTPGIPLSTEFGYAHSEFLNSESIPVFNRSFSLSNGNNQIGTETDVNNRSVWIKLNPGDGTLSGNLIGLTFNSSGKPLKTPIHGVILQGEATAGGYFFDGVENGSFELISK